MIVIRVSRRVYDLLSIGGRRSQILTDKYTAAEDQNACSKMWNVYTLEAERYDKAVVESWKGDMNGMLIFVRDHSWD